MNKVQHMTKKRYAAPDVARGMYGSSFGASWIVAKSRLNNSKGLVENRWLPLEASDRHYNA